MRLLILGLFVIITGCNGKTEKNAPVGLTEAPVEEPVEVPVITPVDSKFVGVWRNCRGTNNNTTSTSTTYSLSTNSLTITITSYSSSICETANAVFEQRRVFSMEGFGDNYTAKVVGASVKSLTTNDLNYSNSNSYCGYNDWVLGVPKDALNRNCSGSVITPGQEVKFSLSIEDNQLIVKLPDNSSDNFHATLAGTINPGVTGVGNGKFMFHNKGISHMYSLNNNGYNYVAHNPTTSEVYFQSGAYTVDQATKTITFTVNTETPSCGAIQGSSFSFTYLVNPSAMVFKDRRGSYAAESTSWSVSDFTDAYTGYALDLGCM